MPKIYFHWMKIGLSNKLKIKYDFKEICHHLSHINHDKHKEALINSSIATKIQNRIKPMYFYENRILNANTFFSLNYFLTGWGHQIHCHPMDCLWTNNCFWLHDGVIVKGKKDRSQCMVKIRWFVMLYCNQIEFMQSLLKKFKICKIEDVVKIWIKLKWYFAFFWVMSHP